MSRNSAVLDFRDAREEMDDGGVDVMDDIVGIFLALRRIKGRC